MEELVRAECGFCRKAFKLRRDQLNREVRCPHCKTKVRISAPTETALEAAAAISEVTAKRGPVAARHEVVMPRGGVRSKGLAIAWVVVLGVAFLGMIVGLAVYLGMKREDSGARTAVPRAAQPVGPSSVAPGPSPYVPPAGPGAEPPGEADATSGPPYSPPAMGPAQIILTAEKILHGYKDGTVSYVVGKAANRSGAEQKGVQVVVDLYDDEGRSAGTAQTLIRRLAPGEEVWFVAASEHAPAVRASRAMPRFELDPQIVSGPPAEVQITGFVYPKPDPGGFNTVGTVKIPLRNVGPTMIAKIEASVVLFDREGDVLSAVREDVYINLAPGREEELKIRYERAIDSRLRDAQAHVQAVAQP